MCLYGDGAVFAGGVVMENETILLSRCVRLGEFIQVLAVACGLWCEITGER